MKSPAKKADVSQEKEALEIIELASAELESLARAFNLITEACGEYSMTVVDFDSEFEENLVH